MVLGFGVLGFGGGQKCILPLYKPPKPRLIQEYPRPEALQGLHCSAYPEAFGFRA